MSPRRRFCGRPPVASVIALAVSAVVIPSAARSQSFASVPAGFVDERIVSNLGLPVGMAFLPDGRLFVIGQNSARIDLIRMGPPVSDDSVGFVPGVVPDGERGLLGIAVDPAWPARPYIYTHSTHTGSKIRISRFKASGALSSATGLVSIDPASRFDLLNDIPDNADNHNGGTVRFGTDGKLYVSLGEDASPNAAQDTTSLRGVILRLEVATLADGPGTATRAQITPAGNPFATTGGLNARLIWAYGLRNPFRFQVDAATGRLLITDVGQDTWEETDIAATGGLNFGWPRYEGNEVFNAGAALTGSATFPIYVIAHSTGARAIISAGIYRRPAGATRGFPAEYEGEAFVSDYYSGVLKRLHPSGSSWTPSDWGQGLQNVSDYAIGPDGGLWYCRQFVSDFNHSGEIHHIVNANSTSVGESLSRATFSRPYPSPSTGSVELRWSLPRSSRVSLVIYDVRGRIVRVIAAPATLDPGPHQASWDGKDARGRQVDPGLYFARLGVDATTLEQRVPIVR